MCREQRRANESEHPLPACSLIGDKAATGSYVRCSGEELDGENHAEADQFFRIEQGKVRIIIDGVTHKVKLGDCAVVPAGAYVNLFCTGHDPLKIYMIYGPSHHRDKLIQKAEAADSDETFDAKAIEQAADVVRI